MFKNRLFLTNCFLIAVGILLMLLAKVVWGHNPASEFLQKYQETIIVYEESRLLEDEERLNALLDIEVRLSEIALDTQDERLAAAAFYSLGTIWLEEFWEDKNNTSGLKKAIIYLQESLIKNPDLEKAKRNLERAWREVKKQGLADELGFSLDYEGALDGQLQDGKEVEADSGGTASIQEPLPHSDETGYGRGKDERDY